MREEIFPLVDEDGNVIGSATRKECHGGTMWLHPVVHLHIFNNEGMLYLQKRSMKKDIQPGKWDTAVGGHIDFGEEVETALRREAREELGVTGFEPEFCYKYIWDSPVERELVNTYKTIFAGDIKPDLDEVDEGKFWSFCDIEQNIGKDVFTPNFEKEFCMLKNLTSKKYK